jgi:RNA 3'-terminal phosphate cyclase (ATP)
MGDWVEVDGSYGEGGGQILRTSLSLAALTGRPLRITRIRAGRPQPGLAAQHLTAVRAVATVCGGEVRGAAFGSQQLEFIPGSVRAGAFEFDVAAERGSAGACSLVLQALLPALLAAPGPAEVTIHGGTNVAWSPPYEYLLHVLLPCLQRMGMSVEVARPRAGFFPHGGGTLRASIYPPTALRPLLLPEAGEVERVVIHSVVSDRLPAHIAQRQAAACQQALAERFPRAAAAAELIAERPPAGGPGTCVLAAVQYQYGHGGFSSLGERGKPAEQVGAAAGRQLVAFLTSGATLDERLSDQVLIYAALAKGQSSWTTPAVTAHFRSNVYVIQQFLSVPVTWREEAKGVWRITVGRD